MKDLLGNIVLGVLGFFTAIFGLVVVSIVAILGSALTALPFVLIIGLIYWLFF